MNDSGVLIVDDEPLVRSFVRTALEAIARVEEAADAERALQVLEVRGRSIGLLLVDQVLPRRSGLEVLRITKRKWPWVAVVILTGFGSEELAVQALRAGASDYLKKPIDVATLRQLVTRLIARAGSMPASRPVPIGTTQTRHGHVHPNIERALAFMGEHFAEAMTLADVAREAGLSRFHFCRLFHHEMGVPFHTHLNDLRMSRAKVLLADPRFRVSEVAYAVGFNDLAHFDRTFRKVVGRSPSQYRALLHCA